ncbi:hypothetical protein KY290_007884 [Solanum tuberosum]|uniref:PUM-HD domain-containing protein n=1 Tax=Solanum tuberosum TaxID=4113 RepID=A0ABQ7W8P6_SOLTU|nr:hypothetical protein KY290_007884 [Solanum tuberosum]
MQLSEDQYGNYLVQHLLRLKLPRVTDILIDTLQGNFLTLSCNKYASNVVEKIILDLREEHSTRVITELLSNPSGSMLLMDPYVSNHRRGYFDLFRLNIAEDNMNGNRKISYGWYLGNTHDDMLLAKLEIVNTGSSEPDFVVVSFIIFCQIPCLVNVRIEKILDAPFTISPCCFAVCFQHGSGTSCVVEWLVFNRVNAGARKGLVLGPMRLLLSFSGGHVVGNFPPHEAFVLGGSNSFPGMNMWSDGENDQTSSSKSCLASSFALTFC